LCSLTIVFTITMLGMFVARRGDKIWTAIVGVPALIVMVTTTPTAGPGLLAGIALCRARWREAVGGRTLALTIVLGFGPLIWNVFTPSLPLPTLGEPRAHILGLGEWSRVVLAIHFLEALPGALMRIGVTIRSVSRRLTLSHVLTGVVPLVLVGALWFVSTYL